MSNANPSLRTGWHLPQHSKVWILTTGVLLAIGIFKNINLLMLLASVLLAVLLVNAPAAWWRTRGLAGRRRFPEFLLAGDPSIVRVNIWRQGSPRGRVAIEDYGPVQQRTWTWADGFDGPLTGPILLPHRGRLAWGPLIASSGFPFGLIYRRVVLMPGQEVLVLPRLGRVHRGLLRRHLRGVDPRAERVRRPALLHRTAQAEFHGLREYRTGDSPRSIHWKTSARRGELMVREFEDLPGQDLVIVLDSGSYAPEIGGNPNAAFEEAVSLTASVCWEWCQHKGDRLGLGVAGAVAQAHGGLTSTELALETLNCLADARPGPDYDPAAVARDLVDRMAVLTPPSASVLVVGHGRSTLLEPLRRRLERPAHFLDTSEPSSLDFYTPSREK
jgi:uncharacterized protein (DUF58 family)